MTQSKSISKLLIASLLMVVASCPMSYSAILSPQKALQRATGIAPPAIHLSETASSYQLTYTLTDEANRPSIYLFSTTSALRGGGDYIVVSADDMADPMLGYGTMSDFDAEKMPSAMKWWLEEYSRQIEAARNHAPQLKAIERPERPAIAPMVTTKWNQDAPYNNMCPIVNGSRSVTGCVATAMAQVVNYHKWPEKGIGKHEYYLSGSMISFDYGSTTFDWANMIDDYANGAGTERQRSAVAKLMFGCGVSVDMNYSPAESGAPDLLVAAALVDYFNYDKNIRYAERDYFGLLEWEQFIYDQLRDYGPVQYSGSSSMGGHSFVCDGYSEDGYFHFNWGWGGISDGYFRLTALDPPMQGIGGAASGYNYDQAIIGNIRKPKGNSEMYFNLMMDQGFNVTPVKTATATKPGDKIMVDRRVINYSIATANGSVGVKFTNTETGEVRYGTAATRISMPSITPLQSYTTEIPSTLKSGTYELTPAMCGSDGVWKDLPVKLSTIQRVVMTVKGGKCTFEPGTEGSVEVKDIDLLTPIYLGNLFRMTLSINNPGDSEFVGQVVPTLASGRTPVAKADPIAVDLLPGESQEMEFIGVFNHFSSSTLPSPGKYNFFIVKESTNEILSSGIEVELHGVPEDVKLSVDAFAINGDASNVDRNNLKFSGKITCEAGYFGRYLTVVIFPYQGGDVSSVGFFSTSNIFVSEGESGEFTAGGMFGAGEPGKKYFAALFDGQDCLTPSGEELIFTLSNVNETPVIEADGEILNTRIFHTSGATLIEQRGKVEINDLRLPHGIYIIEVTTPGGCRTEKVVL